MWLFAVSCTAQATTTRAARKCALRRRPACRTHRASPQHPAPRPPTPAAPPVPSVSPAAVPDDRLDGAAYCGSLRFIAVHCGSLRFIAAHCGSLRRTRQGSGRRTSQPPSPPPARASRRPRRVGSPRRRPSTRLACAEPRRPLEPRAPGGCGPSAEPCRLVEARTCMATRVRVSAHDNRFQDYRVSSSALTGH